ncbi:MAG: hypothetical protein HUK23_05895 [Sphaerochaetaceae bacterium]|nr:hypothetical protein [Sphaerochaetaceae bacterium]
MNKKEWLLRAKNISRIIEKKEKRLESIRSKLGDSAKALDGLGSSSTPHSPFEADLLFAIDLEKEIQNLNAQLQQARTDIWYAIKGVSNPNVEEVLIYRYLDYKEWVDISRCMDFSLDYVYRLHRRGLESLKIGN